MNINISRRVFNDVYLPFLNNEERTLVFYGGAGSGKSFFVTERYIYRLMNEEGRILIVARKTARTNRDSTFALFKQVIKLWGVSELFTVSESDMRIKCANGNAIIFVGLDDVEKIKSVTGENGVVTDIWIEEASEISKKDFMQLNLRLRGGNISKQIILTLNPINVLHWIKTDLIDKGKASVLKTTYKDNRFLDEEYKKELESYKDIDPYYYAVYCLGEWGTYGATVFDAQSIAQRLTQIPKADSGLFDDGFRLEENGFIKIYKYPDSQVPYVIGADTSGEGSDYFAAHVVNNITGEQVAVLHGQFDEDYFAKQLYELGKFYNNALVGIEANFSSYPIKELERLGYENQYIRMREDTFTNSPVKAYGFKTDRKTRPLIISELVKYVRDTPHLINDRSTLEEMLTFVRNEKGRAEAQAGAHDDLVMSLAISLYIRDQQSYSFIPLPPKKPVYNFEFEKPKPSPLGGKITII